VPRALLPGELVGGVGRTRRDWAVDVLVLCAAVVLGLVAYGYAARYEHQPAWIDDLDLPLGALACVSLWWRRRFPLGVSLLAVPALALANSSFGAGMVITANLALRVPWRRSLPVLGLYVVASAPNALFVSDSHGADWTTEAFVLAYYLVFFAWGTALRARRQLVVALREEHARRLAGTRRAERAAIAREMHDVLAHRISLLSVHAGALAYRTKQAGAGSGPALSAAEVAESAQVIRDNAHQALDELHEVLNVLRTDGDPEPGAAPLPRLADLRGLVEEARAAGQPVDFRDELPRGEASGGGRPGPADPAPAGRPADAPRPQVQRTAYRVVQEGLTNARKHAPGARVTVLLAGGPTAGLTVEVANPLPSGTIAPAVPGAGAGLVGLGERVELDGGRLEHSRADGTFTLRARLPWSAR
jgi:signal transduction histidine kinase